MNKSLKLNTRFLKIVFIIIFFLFLAILQSSFFVHLSIYNAKLNIVFIIIFLFSFLNNNSEYVDTKKHNFALLSAVIGGMLLDIVSTYLFGVFTLTLLLIALLIKKVSISFSKYNTTSFLFTFLSSFLLFKIFFSIFTVVLTFIFAQEFLFVNPFNLVLIIELLYNTLIACVLFLLIKLKRYK